MTTGERMQLPLPSLPRIFGSAFATGFSGAIAPGPLLLVCAHQTIAAGLGAGMLTVVGHAATELILVAALMLGLAAVLRARPDAFRWVKAVAGVTLVALGAFMLISAPSARFAPAAGQPGPALSMPLLMGAAVSIGNPYFTLWWATVGLGLLGNAKGRGRAGVGAFYIGHVLSDFVWFGFVAGSLALGRTTILGETSYRILLGLSGLFMVGFGIYFALGRLQKRAGGNDGGPPGVRP